MLKGFRNIASTWVGKILGIFLVVGLAGFGITGVLTSLGSNTIVRVGDQEVSAQDFQRSYNVQLNNMASQFGQPLTPEMALAFGIPSNVLNQLSADAALDELASKMGLGVSADRLAENLANDRSFAGLLGRFDRDVFTQVLQNNGLTEKQYFDQRRQDATREQVALALFSNTYVPQTAIALANRFGNDTRTIDYFTFGRDTLLPIDPANDAQQAAYLEENQSTYRTQEMRTVTLLSLTPQVLAERYDVSEAELATEYERRSASLFRPETRTIEQVILTADSTVSWFTLGLAGGKSFEQLVEEADLTPTNIGTFMQNEMTDAELADAAFGLSADEFAIIDSVQGKRAVRVTEITEGGIPSIGDVSDQLSQSIKISKSRADYLDILDLIEESRAALVGLADIAAQNGLQVTTAVVTAGGEALGNDFDANGVARLSAAIFAANLDSLTPAVALSSESNAWFELSMVEEARDQTLAEVQQRLALDWLTQQQNIALQEKADVFASALADGQDLETIAIANGLFPQISEAFGRGGTTTIAGPVAASVFEGGVDHVDAAQLNANEYLVFQVTSVTAPVAALGDAESNLIETSFRDSIFAEFVTGIRDKAGVNINQELLEYTIGISDNGPNGGRTRHN